jgi:hypothetical protein
MFAIVLDPRFETGCQQVIARNVGEERALPPLNNSVKTFVLARAGQVQAFKKFANSEGLRAADATDKVFHGALESRHICNSHRSMAHAKLSHNR